MTPERIRDQLAALRAAGAELRARPARTTLLALGRVLDAWSDAASPWRRALEAELPAATGFSPAVVRAGLAAGLAHWTGEALLELAAAELGGTREAPAEHVFGFETTAVVLAGSIPMPTLLSLLAPLALRSPVLAKPASRDSVTARLVAASIAEVDPLLGRCIEVAAFPGSDSRAMAALLGADCVVANGSDEVVAEIGARVKPPRRLVPYGNRLSLAAVAGEALRGAASAGIADRLARDVALWDQLGCLSPVAAFCVGSAACAERLAEELARALADAEARLPRGAVPPAAAAAIARERAEAELRAASGRPVALFASKSTAWTVIREDSPRERPAPLHRFLRVLPVADPGELLSALRPLGPQLAAVALAGFAGATPPLARALAELGASRICPIGELQSPPLDWPRDNRGVLAPLARLTSLQLEPD